MKLIDSFGEVEVTTKQVMRYFDSFAACASKRTSSLVLGETNEYVSESGNSVGLGNELDLQWLLALRRRSHLIVSSLKTANAESYKLPKKATLVLFGKNTPVRLPRISDGENRLVIVGGVDNSRPIPNAQWLTDLDISWDLGMLQPSGKQPSCVNFEFGRIGLLRIGNQIDSLFITARRAETELSEYGIPLQNLELRARIWLQDMCLTWWERRGI